MMKFNPHGWTGQHDYMYSHFIDVTPNIFDTIDITIFNYSQIHS